MKLYLVQYHDDSWGAQQSLDEILGIYDSEEKAYKRAEKFESEYAHKDDTVAVLEFELNEDMPAYGEYMEELCE